MQTPPDLYYYGIKFPCGLVAVDNEYEDQEFNDASQGQPIRSIHESEAEKGHVKVLQLHEKAAGMWDVQKHMC